MKLKEIEKSRSNFLFWFSTVTKGFTGKAPTRLDHRFLQKKTDKSMDPWLAGNSKNVTQKNYIFYFFYENPDQAPNAPYKPIKSFSPVLFLECADGWPQLKLMSDWN